MAFQTNLHLLPKNDFVLIEEEMKKLHFGKGYVPTDFTPALTNQRRRSGSRKNKRPNAQTEQGQPTQTS